MPDIAHLFAKGHDLQSRTAARWRDVPGILWRLARLIGGGWAEKEERACR